MHEDNANSKQRFEELLPWYVNGTLEATQREWVEQYARAHADAADELKSTLRFSAKLHEEVEASIPSDTGLNHLMARIRENKNGKRPSVGVMSRMSNWLRMFFDDFHFSPGFALAATIMVVQAGVIGMLVMKQPKLSPGGEDYSTYRSVGEEKKIGPLLKINIKPDAREQDIRLLLVSIGGKLVGGPGQLGDYYVQVATQTLDEATEKLKHSNLIDMVEVVTKLPETD